MSQAAAQCWVSFKSNDRSSGVPRLKLSEVANVAELHARLHNLVVWTVMPIRSVGMAVRWL